MDEEATRRYVEMIYEGFALELELEIARQALAGAAKPPGNKAESARNLHAKRAIEADLQTGGVQSDALKAIVGAMRGLNKDDER